MKPFTSNLGVTIRINAKLLFASGCAWTSWVVWPTTIEWWGLYLLSVLLGVASLLLLIDALKLMVQVYQREKVIRDYVAQGSAPKSSEMASVDNLTKAGMR